MNNGAHVLVVSRDQMLLQTRALILGAYFQVEPAGRVPEAEVAMSRVKFDLVILCYSIPDDEYQKLIELCHLQNPRPKILTLLDPADSRPRDAGDGVCQVEQGPFQLLKMTADMVGFQLKPMGRASHS